MTQNNNQEQKCWAENQTQQNTIHQNSLSKKFLQLDFDIQNSDRCYLTAKKAIKCFSKLKRPFNLSKNSQRTSEKGVFSQKIMPSSIGQDIECKQKANIVFPGKVKNIFEAYKETLEQKHRKKLKQMQRSLLKIDTNKMSQNQAASLLIIEQKGEQIKKRLSCKNIQSNFSYLNCSRQQKSPINNRQNSQSKKYNSFRMMDTIDDDCHNFIRPSNHIKKLHMKQMARQRGDLIQIKRKCYTEEETGNPYAEFNKTKNITFRLPATKRNDKKNLIENFGGSIYALPTISQNTETPKNISYRVKSLKNNPTVAIQSIPKDSASNLNGMKRHEQRLSVNLSRIKSNRHQTLPVQAHQQSIFTQYQMQNQQTIREEQSLEFQYAKRPGKVQNLADRNKRNRRKYKKDNILGQIQGWNTQNNSNSFESTLYPFNSVSNNLQPGHKSDHYK